MFLFSIKATQVQGERRNFTLQIQSWDSNPEPRNSEADIWSKNSTVLRVEYLAIAIAQIDGGESNNRLVTSLSSLTPSGAARPSQESRVGSNKIHLQNTVAHWWKIMDQNATHASSVLLMSLSAFSRAGMEAGLPGRARPGHNLSPWEAGKSRRSYCFVPLHTLWNFAKSQHANLGEYSRCWRESYTHWQTHNLTSTPQFLPHTPAYTHLHTHTLIHAQSMQISCQADEIYTRTRWPERNENAI